MSTPHMNQNALTIAIVRNEDELIRLQYGLWNIDPSMRSEILEYGESPSADGYITFAVVANGKRLYVWPTTK